MTAVVSMKLSATPLTDLPGNKMPHLSGPKQSFQLPKPVRLSTRRAVPSEHFIKASDQESSSGEGSSSEEEPEELITSRSSNHPFEILQDNAVFKPFKLPTSTKLSPPRPLVPQLKTKNFVSDESINKLLQEDEFDIKPSSSRSHLYNASKERRLLDELIEFDEEEDLRFSGIKTDEDIYLMWKCGDTKKISKTGNETQQTKHNRTSKASSLAKKDSKLELLCAWETVSNKKPVQRLKEERKQRLTQPSYLYHGKNSNLEKTNPTTPFTFFHYTDIACYIQQYRSQHVCENPCANHSICCQDHSQFQGVQDLNFPFKFDLTTNSIRNKLSSRGLNQNGRVQEVNHQQNRTTRYEDETYFKGNDSASGCLTPVGIRPSHSNKSPVLENWNNFPESPSRLRYHLKKIWRSYEQKQSSGPQAESPSHDVTHQDVTQHTLSALLRTDDATIKSNSARPGEVTIDQRTSEDKKFQEASSQGHARVCEMKLDENCLQVNRESLSRASLEHFSDQSTFIGSRKSIRRENHKRKRMRSLIASEISNLQRKQVITIEQKRKLDKFKDVLNAMPPSGKLNNKQSGAIPNGNITKQNIAGSVRAYYTRTATSSNSLINTVRTQTVKCGPDIDIKNRNDDQPIIYVTQPHIRHINKKPRQAESSLKGKKLIGGKTVEKVPRHPADAKQFTRITDLLRIKERKQSGRQVVTGLRSTAAGSKTPNKLSRSEYRTAKEDISTTRNQDLNSTQNE